MRYLKPYSYLWVTLAFFLISIIGHWLFGWFAFVDEQLAHGESVSASAYTVNPSHAAALGRAAQSSEADRFAVDVLRLPRRQELGAASSH